MVCLPSNSVDNYALWSARIFRGIALLLVFDFRSRSEYRFFRRFYVRLEAEVGWRVIDIDRLLSLSASERKVLYTVSPRAGPDNGFTAAGVVGFEEKLGQSFETGICGLDFSIGLLTASFCVSR